MSEVITGGVAAAAAGACLAAAAAAGIVIGAARITYKAINWLTEQAKHDLEKLEKELELTQSLPVQVTTKEAREEFQKKFREIQKRVKEIPTLRDKSEPVANVLTLQNSTLGLFVGKDKWNALNEVGFNHKTFNSVVRQAADNLTTANALYVKQSICDVANDLGFTQDRRIKRIGEKEIIVLENNEGRALVSEVIASEVGAKINLDLTGFGDGSCHLVMDRILKGLTAKGIRLDNIQRRTHYRREGVLAAGSNKKSNRTEAKKQAVIQKENERRRRQNHHIGNKQRIKN
jgi:hypothetical protein